ncbi:MAG: retropepsin-like aspartic protease [Halieaceae bacterium]|jgi:predicted aspartyl protease|nr:retropepsin-like aspartic protease [Halieaceae bacterium]
MSKSGLSAIILASFALAMAVSAEDVDQVAESGDAIAFVPFAHQVPLQPTSAGSFTLIGTLGGATGEFLLDTGASMITVSREFFESMPAQVGLKPSRRVAARLASGRTQTVEVYEFSTLQLGQECVVGPVEVAVMPRGGRNLLGMSVLMNAAPFAVSASPPALALSRCGQALAVAVR